MLMLWLPSPHDVYGTPRQSKEYQCHAYIENHVRIGKLVHGEAACPCPAHVNAVGARLIAADGEGNGSVAAAFDSDALAVLQPAVHIDLDTAGTVDRAGVDYIGCHGYCCPRGNLGGRE